MVGQCVGMVKVNSAMAEACIKFYMYFNAVEWKNYQYPLKELNLLKIFKFL